MVGVEKGNYEGCIEAFIIIKLYIYIIGKAL